MAKNLYKLPEDILVKFELGLETSFKFKDKYNYHYKVIVVDGCMRVLVKRQKFNINEWEEVPDCRSVDGINRFLSSDRFYHWHVDVSKL